MGTLYGQEKTNKKRRRLEEGGGWEDLRRVWKGA